MILETGGQLVVSLTEAFVTCWMSILQYYYYFHKMVIFHVNPGQPVPPRAVLFQCSRTEPLGISERGFQGSDVLPVTQPSMSKHCREHKALEYPNQCLVLASSFLHPPPDTPDGIGIAAFMPAHRSSTILCTYISCIHFLSGVKATTIKVLLLLLHPFNGICSRSTWVTQHQKGKPFWILLEQEMMGWQWHQLDHMQIISTSLQRDNHASTSPLGLYMPDASKHWRL